MGISRSYARISAQVEWLLGQRDVTERALAEAVRAALTGEALGPLFPKGSHENVILRLALVFGLRAPSLDPRYLAMTPLELKAVSDGETTLAKAFALVGELERRELPRSEVRDRVCALLLPDDLDVESLWSADGSVLAPALNRHRERMKTVEAAALIDEVAAELARLVVARSEPSAFAADMRNALLGDRAARQAVLAAGLPPDRLDAAAAAARASMSAEDSVIAAAVHFCGNFDYGVETGVITAQLLGQYLQHVFWAIAHREQVPEMGPPHLKAPLQWLCDLFVDAANADPTVFELCERQVAQIGAGAATTAELAAELARRWIAAKGIDTVLAEIQAHQR